jgi:hypothetical protein
MIRTFAQPELAEKIVKSVARTIAEVGRAIHTLARWAKGMLKGRRLLDELQAEGH